MRSSNSLHQRLSVLHCTTKRIQQLDRFLLYLNIRDSLRLLNTAEKVLEWSVSQTRIFYQVYRLS